MIYFENFKDCKEFNQVFGITQHGNGVKSRKNKILLACLKDRKLHKWWAGFKADTISRGANKEKLREIDLFHATSMDDLKRFAKFLLSDVLTYIELFQDATTVCNSNVLSFGEDFPYKLRSSIFRLDNTKGLCADGDTKAIRYVNTERSYQVFKMKAGKFVSKCIEEEPLRDIMPEQMKRWIGEEFARDWQSYAEQHIGAGRYTLHVDNNFADIYDSECCLGSFGSCMTDQDTWSFYVNSIACKAAYLTDASGNIVARCIVYSDVMDERGNHYRLAERQYSSEQNDALKQVLVDMLINAGEIDGYKRVGADCHDNKNFVRNDGTSMHDLTLSIDCNLDFGDTLSYQDSFVYYDKDAGIAYNDSCVDYGYELNTTNGELQPTGDYSEYLQEYIPEDESAYDDYYDDYCYASDISTAIYRGCRISINGDRASFDYNIWHWSDFEDAYIYYTECCYVDREGDYFLLDDCVRDIADYWQLEKDCVFSQYSDEYILADYAKWSEDMASYIDSDDAIWCDYEQDWIHNDLVCYSEITGRHYCSEQSMRKDEEHFRKEHALALMA